DRHGGRDCRAVRPAMARSQSGQVHALQGLDEQDLAGGVLYFVRDPGRAGRSGADPRAYVAVAGLYLPVLRLLHSDAVLYPAREDQTGSGKGDWLMKKLFAVLLLAALPVLSFAAEHGGP